MANDDPQNALLERQIEAVLGDLRLIVHTLDMDGQAIWHLAARSVPPAPPGWISICSGSERTTQAAMCAVEAEASRWASRWASVVPGSQPLQGQARLKHCGVEFLLTPVAPRGTMWAIYPASGLAEGTIDGEDSFRKAFEAAQAAIDSWLNLHPADRVRTIH